MRKWFALLLALALAAGLAGCSFGDAPPAGASSSGTDVPGSSASSSSAPPSVSSVPSSLSAPSVAPSSSSSQAAPGSASGQQAEFLNRELLGFIRGSNAQLRQWRDGKCCAYNVGAVTDALVFYGPYIEFLLVARGDEGYLPGYAPQEVVYTANPYVDDVKVQGFFLQAEYDVATGTVGQESLQQFFLTQETLTYALITEKLGQTPELTHDPEGAYRALAEYDPLGEAGYTAVPGGLYGAVFAVEGKEISVSFLQSGGDYIALGASVMDADPGWFLPG